MTERSADTTLAVLAVLLQTLPGDPRLTYSQGTYKLHYGTGHMSYLQAPTLSELAERGR